MHLTFKGTWRQDRAFQDLLRLCDRLNAALIKFEFPAFPTMMVPLLNLAAVPMFLGMRYMREQKMAEVIADWNVAVGMNKGVSLQWNYGYAILGN